MYVVLPMQAYYDGDPQADQHAEIRPALDGYTPRAGDVIIDAIDREAAELGLLAFRLMVHPTEQSLRSHPTLREDMLTLIEALRHGETASTLRENPANAAYQADFAYLREQYGWRVHG